MATTTAVAVGLALSGEPDPEALLDLAARLALAGQIPSACRLARAVPCTEHFARLVRSRLLGQSRWPYRTRRAGTGGCGKPTAAELQAARSRLGTPEPDLVVAEPVTPAGRACAQYRREWHEGINFLLKWLPQTDDEE